jgi:hypothetical protein
MKNRLVMAYFITIYVCSASSVFAQAFGEYGRAVGNVPHGKSVAGPKGSGGVTKPKPGKGVTSGVTVPDGRGLPTRLVVAVNDAGLYPRQDDESQKLEQLSQGEILTPMMQNAGGNEWYMVKTSKGTIGWMKSSDVREEKLQK